MNIKELRKKSGLTQKEFSKKYHIPKRTIEDWEREARTPPTYVPELIEKIMELEKDLE